MTANPFCRYTFCRQVAQDWLIHLQLNSEILNINQEAWMKLFQAKGVSIGQKINCLVKQNSTRGSLEHEVNKHGRAGWQGNNFSSKATCKGSLERQVNKKCPSNNTIAAQKDNIYHLSISLRVIHLSSVAEKKSQIFFI